MLLGTRKWLLVILFSYAGHGAFGQTIDFEQPITLDVQDEQLAKVLELIDAQIPLSFAYNPDKVPTRAVITYKADGQPLKQVLFYLTKKFHLSFEVIEQQIVLLPAADMPPLTFNLSGFVSDINTGEALIGATISVDSLHLGTIANGYGYYSLNLPYGKHTLHASFLGYTFTPKSIYLTANTSIDIGLLESTPQLQEIVVQGFNSINIDLIQTGKVGLSPRTVAELPTAFGEKDVIKSLETIPGLNLQSDGSTFFYVRGGNKDQNLILIDDAPIYNPSHLLGFYSSIIPDAVNSIEVYKSDFPLSKGGRLSSVIDIKTKEGNKNRFSAWGNIGIVSTQVGIEGPFKKGVSSYILSGRLSRIKWIFKNEIQDLDQFQFYDITGKTNFKLNDKNKLYFSFYTGADRFLTQTTGLSWTNINGSVRWNNLINENTFVNTTLYGSNYEYLLYINRQRNALWRSRIGEFGLKTDFSHFMNSQQELAFGFNINGRTINPGNLTQENVPANLIVSVKNNLETAAYLQHEIRFKDKWGIKYGFRASVWTSLGDAFEFTFNENGQATDTTDYRPGEAYHNYFQLEPRITTSYFINHNASLKLSYGRSVQNLHLMTNTISPFTSFEVWLPSGPNIKPQQADQFTIGYYRSLTDIGVTLEAESYYKLMYNQIDYAAHAATLLNPTIESELVFGTAKGYGIELLAKKEAGRIRGMISYTYAKMKSKFKAIDNGAPFTAYSDRPHNINVSVNYDIGLKVTLGSNFNFTSGLPFSSPTGFYKYDGNEVPIYGQKNNDRYPVYHRLDISAKFVLNKHLDSNFQHSLTVSIYNIYGRKNPIFINFNKSANENGGFVVPSNLLSATRTTTQTFLYRITPSISYQFRF